MNRIHKILPAVAAVALTGACAAEGPQARALTGTAPAGATTVMAIDAGGRSFSTTPDVTGAFRLEIESIRPVTAFVVDSAGTLRVLRVAPAPGAPATQTSLPNWSGEVSTAQMSTCDCNANGVDEDAEGDDNVLAQIDTDNDGQSDLDDSDDDNDGVADDDDADSDGSGEDDDAEDLDTDDDGRPDSCDDDDDDDGISDEDDEDEANDSDGDGIDDDADEDDDNDGTDDDDGEEEDDDVEDDSVSG